jgi:flagellar capping protein FliD
LILKIAKSIGDVVALEFAWNTQKNGMGAVKGLEKEQDREGKISNKEIVPEKTHLNYDLVQSDLNLYQRVKKRVEEVRPVSRIQKNSVVDYSNIITVPQEQFKTWGIEDSKEYLKEVYDYFCKEFGKENVVSAKVHLDETTPHMHLHFVPVSEEGKLQARKVMTPQRINKIHTEAPIYLQERGFDVFRGKGKTDKSLEIKEFKAEMLENKINQLENKLAEMTSRHQLTVEQLKKAQEKAKEQFNTIKETSESLSKLQEHTKGVLGRLDNIEAKKGLFSDKLTVSPQDYSTLVNLAKVGESKSLENLQLKSKIGDLTQKLDKYNAIDAEFQRLKGIDLKYYELQRKYRNLNITFERVEKALDKLDLTDKMNNELKAMKIAERNLSKGFDR